MGDKQNEIDNEEEFNEEEQEKFNIVLNNVNFPIIIEETHTERTDDPVVLLVGTPDNEPSDKNQQTEFQTVIPTRLPTTQPRRRPTTQPRRRPTTQQTIERFPTNKQPFTAFKEEGPIREGVLLLSEGRFASTKAPIILEEVKPTTSEDLGPIKEGVLLLSEGRDASTKPPTTSEDLGPIREGVL